MCLQMHKTYLEKYTRNQEEDTKEKVASKEEKQGPEEGEAHSSEICTKHTHQLFQEQINLKKELERE